MSHLSRRELLASFLGGLVPAAGTVVLARAVLSGSAAQAREADSPPQPPASLRDRADQVLARQGPPDEDDDLPPESFVRAAFRRGGFANGGGGGFRNGAFRNGGGGFRNGGFGNGGGGGFRKGGFGNGGGGFGNGGFRNGSGGFRNGGFGNGGGFRNGAFRNY